MRPLVTVTVTALWLCGCGTNDPSLTPDATATNDAAVTDDASVTDGAAVTDGASLDASVVDAAIIDSSPVDGSVDASIDAAPLPCVESPAPINGSICTLWKFENPAHPSRQAPLPYTGGVFSITSNRSYTGNYRWLERNDGTGFQTVTEFPSGIPEWATLADDGWLVAAEVNGPVHAYIGGSWQDIGTQTVRELSARPGALFAMTWTQIKMYDGAWSTLPVLPWGADPTTIWADSSTLYAANDNGIYSWSGGTTWATLTAPSTHYVHLAGVPGQGVFALSGSPSTPQLYQLVSGSFVAVSPFTGCGNTRYEDLRSGGSWIVVTLTCDTVEQTWTWDGSWSQIPTPPGSIRATSAGLFSGAADGNVAKLVGGVWERLPQLQTMVAPRTITGTPSGSVFIGGPGGIMKQVGDGWCAEPSPPDRAVLSLWNAPDDTLFALATGVCSPPDEYGNCGQYPELWRRPPAGSWAQISSAAPIGSTAMTLLPSEQPFAQLIGSSSSNVFGVVSMLNTDVNGPDFIEIAFHWDGTNLSQYSSLCAFWYDNDPTPLYMVGDLAFQDCDAYLKQMPSGVTIYKDTGEKEVRFGPASNPVLARWVPWSNLTFVHGDGSMTTQTLSGAGWVMGGELPDIYRWDSTIPQTFMGYDMLGGWLSGDPRPIDATQVYSLASSPPDSVGVLRCTIPAPP